MAGVRTGWTAGPECSLKKNYFSIFYVKNTLTF